MHLHAHMQVKDGWHDAVRQQLHFGPTAPAVSVLTASGRAE
jgi:hypothetical protein